MPISAAIVPSTTAIVVASAANSSVAGSRASTSSNTLWCTLIERPKSPLSAWPSQLTNCRRIG
jgi:hypothetical protein